jgi:hypothetical protein
MSQCPSMQMTSRLDFSKQALKPVLQTLCGSKNRRRNLKRRQLFEFTDLANWPDTFRSLLTDFLSFVTNMVQPFQPFAHLIAEAMDAVGTDRVIDLCSGTGGPWFHLREQVEKSRGRKMTVLFTDKFPNRELARRLEDIDGMSFSSEPVDALCPPKDEDGLWSLFDAFHHFKQDQARAILQNAVANERPIVIFEMLQRTLLDLVGTLRLPLIVLLLTPRIRPLRFWRLFFTYLIPIGPIVIAWDGMVSVLRCYTPEELMATAHSLEGIPYHWKAGTHREGIVSVTFLVGYPETQSHSQRGRLGSDLVNVKTTTLRAAGTGAL